MIHHRQVKLHISLMLLAFLCFGTLGRIAWAGEGNLAATLPSGEFPPATASPTFVIKPEKTEIVTLPLVEQNSGNALLTPVVDSVILQETALPGSPGPSPTPTTTPLPPQTGATNLPIVIGASMIYLILLMAWLLVGWRPRKSADL